MKKIVVLTGAGVSAESGLKTFRDAGGLWEGHRIEDVASPEGWQRNPILVLDFYNQRRTQLNEVVPNDAHLHLVNLEQKFEVNIITQNVDDLHERAGSKNILHLHGQLVYVRSTVNPLLRYHIGYNKVNLGDTCEMGSQLRPDIVWFGEAVPEMDNAIKISMLADYFLVIGTSLEVYPAASLINFVPPHCKIFIVDPNRHESLLDKNITVIKDFAGNAVPELVKDLLTKE